MPKKALLFLIPLIIVLLGVIVLVRQSSVWTGVGRLRVALVSPTGKVSLLLLSPSKNEAQVAQIDDDIEVTAAHGLGSWKVGSIWKLGEQEKIGGNVLVKQTLIQSLGVPIVGIWTDSEKIGKISLAKNLLFGTGDLTLKTRLRMIVFILRAPINVSETSLSKSSLGFFAVEPLNDVTDGVITVVDKSKDKSIYVHSLLNLVSNMGGKVLDVRSDKESSGNCIVVGESEFTKKLSLVLECDYKIGKPSEITITNDFLKRF